MRCMKTFLSVLRSLNFNLRLFPLRDALKLPILVPYDLKIYSIHRGTVNLRGKIHPGMIKFGWGEGSYGVPGKSERTKWMVESTATITFDEEAQFGRGTSIRADDNSLIHFGNNFICNSNCFFTASECIDIGNNVVMGWHCNIRDKDGHDIYDCEKFERGPINPAKPVSIGSHVWIAAYVDILKGVKISNDCVIAYRSCVTKAFEEKNVIIGGFPAKIIKENIEWRY